MKENNLSMFGKLTAEATTQSGGSNVTFFLGSTVELPEDEKYTVFAPWDLGWPAGQLEDHDPLEVLESHFVEWYLPISYIKLALAGPVSVEDGFLLESAAGTEISVSLNKKGTFYVTSEGMSQVSKVLQTDIETCIGVMHIISTPLMHEERDEENRDPPREERDGRDELATEDGNVPEVSAVQSESGGSVPGVSIVSDVESGDGDKGGLHRAAVWGIVGAAVLALFALVAGLFALHKRRRHEADEEFDEMWKKACEARRASPFQPPLKSPSSIPPFSWDLLPAVSMHAPNACSPRGSQRSLDGLDACTITPESSHQNSQPNPVGYNGHSHVPTRENSKDLARYLVMATDTSGNLRECSGGVGAYRCNASEYGGSSSLLAKHGNFTRAHSGRLAEECSGSSLPCLIGGGSGLLNAHRRGGAITENGSIQQGVVRGNSNGPWSLPISQHNPSAQRSMDGCLGNECSEEDAGIHSGKFAARNPLEEVSEADRVSSQGSSAQSVSLEFEGTERLRDLDGGDTKATITTRAEVQTDNDTNTIDLSQTFLAVKKRALATQSAIDHAYHPPAYLHDADFVHFSPTRDLQTPPEDTVVPDSVQESIFKSICEESSRESDTAPDSGDQISAEDKETHKSVDQLPGTGQDVDLDRSLRTLEEEEDLMKRSIGAGRNVFVRSTSPKDTLEDETPPELPVSSRLANFSHVEMDSAASHESSQQNSLCEDSLMRTGPERSPMEVARSPDSAELKACPPDGSKLASRLKLAEAAKLNPVVASDAEGRGSEDSGMFETVDSE